MRLIDADELTDILENERPENWTDSPGEIQEQADWDRFIEMVDVAITIDAEPVVRCKDCAYMIPQSNTRYCTVWNAVNGMGDDGFCNYGERKAKERAE